MLINRLQDTATFRELKLPEDYIKNLSENSTDELLEIIARVTASILRHLNLPEDEVAEFTGQVKERKMAELFENFKDVDIPAIRKKARAEGHAEGEARFAKLAQALLNAGRLEDFTKSLTDIKYRQELYMQNNI